VLASLLPGLRELRTPLAIGYLYALALYLFFRDSIPTTAEASGHLKPLYDVVHWLGKPAALAAGAFLAYLMGSVLQVPAAQVSHWLRTALSKHPHPSSTRERAGRLDYLDSTVTRALGKWDLTPDAALSLGQYCGNRIRRALAQNNSPGLEERFEAAVGHLLEDLPQLRTRLYTASKDMYGDYDRLSAEADFKVNVGLAGILLSCAMAVQVHFLWALLLGPMAFLGSRGLAKLREANDWLVQAIVTDLVKSPGFEEYINALGPSTENQTTPGHQ
jgi:hypothetical protein